MAFEQRSIINGKFLREFIGKNVSILVKIEADHHSQVVKARTTDQLPIRLNLTDPLNGNCTDWVEVLGVVTGNDVIRVKEVIIFDDSREEFDFDGHNMLVNIMHNTRDFYVSG